MDGMIACWALQFWHLLQRIRALGFWAQEDMAFYFLFSSVRPSVCLLWLGMISPQQKRAFWTEESWMLSRIHWSEAEPNELSHVRASWSGSHLFWQPTQLAVTFFDPFCKFMASHSVIIMKLQHYIFKSHTTEPSSILIKNPSLHTFLQFPEQLNTLKSLELSYLSFSSD